MVYEIVLAAMQQVEEYRAREIIDFSIIKLLPTDLTEATVVLNTAKKIYYVCGG